MAMHPQQQHHQHPVAPAPWPVPTQTDLAVQHLRALNAIKSLLVWVVVLLAVIAFGIAIITAVAVTVPVYPA